MPRRVPVVLSAVLIAAPALATDTIDSTASTGFVDLPSLNAEERAWVADPKKIPGPARMGFGRAVPVEDMVDAFAAAQWRQTPSGGHVVAVQLHSPGALGLRLGLQLSILPEASLLGFFDANGNPVAAFSGAELNVAEGPFWSPLIRGDTAILAVNLPPGDDPSTAQLSLPWVSHLLSWPFDQTDTSAATGNQCRLDATCHPDWAMASLATALLIYTEERGGTGTCTGTLLRDGDPTTDIPYVVTAQHCVPDQQRAASIETLWLHRTASCNSTDGAPIQSVSGRCRAAPRRPTHRHQPAATAAPAASRGSVRGLVHQPTGLRDDGSECAPSSRPPSVHRNRQHYRHASLQRDTPLRRPRRRRRGPIPTRQLGSGRN